MHSVGGRTEPLTGIQGTYSVRYKLICTTGGGGEREREQELYDLRGKYSRSPFIIAPVGKEEENKLK